MTDENCPPIFKNKLNKLFKDRFLQHFCVMQIFDQTNMYVRTNYLFIFEYHLRIFHSANEEKTRKNDGTVVATLD